LQGKNNPVNVWQIISLDNTSPQTYTLSYSYIYQSYKVNSGNPTKPGSVTVDVSWCGTQIDYFGINLYGPQNMAWASRSVSAVMPVCSNEFVPLIFKVYTDPNAAAGDYQITLGFDNFQFGP
jgi:hypothetical protein